MTEKITTAMTSWIVSLFGDQTWLATIIVSTLPLAELKVAIPFAQKYGYGIWASLGLGMVGSLIIVPILALFFAPIIRWLKKTKLFKKMATSVETKVNKKSEKINGNVSDIDNKDMNQACKARKKWWAKFLGVLAFVAVPIPLTGVWTGTCIAVAIGLNFWSTCGAVLIGNFIAGLIITFLSALLSESIIMLSMLIIIAAIIIGVMIRFVVKRIKARKQKSKV